MSVINYKVISLMFGSLPLQALSTLSITCLEDVGVQPSVATRRTRQHLKRLTVEKFRASVVPLGHEFSSWNIFQEASAYEEKFKLAVIENGNLFWKRSVKCDHFAMTDVDIKTGVFQEDCYMHLTFISSDGLSELICSCGMYTSLIQVAA